MTEKLEVIQADRDAAEQFRRGIGGRYDRDVGILVLAFARHRLSHSAEKEALIEALEEIAGHNWKDQSRARHVARSTLLSMRNNGNG